MKKYLIFGISSELGGVESFIFNYVSAMQDKNNIFEFIIFDKIPEFFLKSSCKNNKVYLAPSRKKNYVGYLKKLNEILTNNHFDVLWYNACTLSDITLLKLAYKYDVSCRIIHSHSSDNMGGKVVYLLHNIHKRLIERYATDYFACSDSAARFMFPSNIINNKSYRVINNAINIKKFIYNEKIRKSVRKSFNITNEIIVGHVGRFHFEKNHKFLIEILRELLLIDNTIKLMLVGSGELKDEVLEIAAKYDVDRNIILLEQRQDVNYLLQAMDIFVFPSLFEGVPMALIEAQAAGLPCVISDTIPQAALVSDNVHIMSLSVSAKEWSSEIFEILRRSTRRSDEELLQKSGFDIRTNSYELKEYLYKIEK